MNAMTQNARSQLIAEAPQSNGQGRIGLTFASVTDAGKRGTRFDLDPDDLAAWGAVAVVSIADGQELVAMQARGMAEAVRCRHMVWFPLSTDDGFRADEASELNWSLVGDALRRMIRSGFNVVVQVADDLGRSADLSIRLLTEIGVGLDVAIELVRKASPRGTTETFLREVGDWSLPGALNTAPERSDAAVRDRAIGAMLGLAVGDAIGTTLEFKHRDTYPFLSDMVGGGPFHLAPGEWTDDTAMAMALATSIAETGRIDETDLMDRFLGWWRNGDYSCTGTCFDIGNTTRDALLRYERSGNPIAGSNDSNAAGNGSLMRLSPVAVRFRRDRDALRDAAARQSRTTHAAPACVDACVVWAEMIADAIEGKALEDILRRSGHGLSRVIARIVEGSWRGRDRSTIKATGYVAHSLEAAIWCIAQTHDFESAVLLAANLGEDADTTAAITGQLAGALYGASGIPQHWRERVAWADRISRLTETLSRQAVKDRTVASPVRSPRNDLKELIATRRIRMSDSRALWQPAWPDGWKPGSDRWRGMVVGLAIGDSLGNTSEGQNPSQRRQRYGQIENYLPNRHAYDEPVGLPSDDTQLCAWAIEQILESGRFDPAAYQALISQRRIYGMGNTVRSALAARSSATDWLAAGQNSAGNGALMRCPGIFAAHLGTDGADLAADAALFAATTHNNAQAISSAVAFTIMLAELMQMDRPPHPLWWIERYVEIARPIEGASHITPRHPELSQTWHGPMWKFVAEMAGQALDAPVSTVAACNSWHSGAFLLETMPSVLLILARHGHDPREALIRAVNDTRDNDTVAAIVGAAVGALHGEQALPVRWRTGLTGCTQAGDNGRLFQLIAATEKKAGIHD